MDFPLKRATFQHTVRKDVVVESVQATRCTYDEIERSEDHEKQWHQGGVCGRHERNKLSINSGMVWDRDGFYA